MDVNLGCLTGQLKSEVTAKLCAEFATYVAKNIDAVLNDLADLQKKLSRQEGDSSVAKDLVADIIKAASVFINTVNDFFCYGKDSDFESMKNDIRQGHNERLLEFISKMDKWLKNVGIAYKDFTQKCGAAAKKCSGFAASCSDKQAEATAKKKKALILAVVGGAALTVVGLVTITVSPLALIITVIIAVAGGFLVYSTFEDYKEKAKCFKSLSLCFWNLAKQGIDLKRQFDSIHNTIMRYEKHHTFLQNTDKEHKDTICSALDQLQEILRLNHSKTLKATETIASVKSQDYRNYL